MPVVRDARLGYNQGRASLGHITLASRSKTIMRGDKYWDTNMTAAKKQNLMKKSILWRGNMVQVLLGRTGMDPSERLAVVRVETQNAKLIRIDCGGEKFITTEDSLSRYPNTLLGDPKRRDKYYDSKTGYHYFDRNQDLFSAILYFYQSPGTFRAPESIDPVVVEEELDFFGINLQKMIDDYDEMVAANNPILPPTMRESINNTITDPSYNKMSMVWGLLDLACIILTISMLVLETIPDYEKHFKNPFTEPYKIAIYSLDVGINLFFTLDLIIKFLSSANQKRFFFDTMNIMDILAVTPFYVELVVFLVEDGTPPPQFFALKVCRIVRVVRVLKLVRHSRQLTEVMEVVSSAKQEFFVLIGVVGVVILLVGTIMYFVEYQIPDDRNEHFISILHGCWWAIVTITTVGYGDLYPRSTLGRLTGSFVVLFGIVVLAFPMTIIISKFQDSFTVKKLNANKEMTRKLREMAIAGYSCAGSSTSSPASTRVVNGKAHIPKQSKPSEPEDECQTRLVPKHSAQFAANIISPVALFK
ncbi:potassium voltage-gated channel subfamily A member 7-like isoform X2 [Bolinopsis microptera]|uniref:potassium voltage-gated channel subfamily A member 7-like isoform X2 n=1 Tax=Bolinopsis microptera TaxID=2820187 RepID=UPI003078FD75